jgi:hypothetical protein
MRRRGLNIRQDAQPARAAYEAWGYRRVTPLVPWDNAPGAGAWQHEARPLTSSGRAFASRAACLAPSTYGTSSLS